MAVYDRGMDVFYIQAWIFRIISIVLLGVEIWAFVNAVRYRPDAYIAASKRTKGFWSALTGIALFLGILGILGSSMFILTLAAIVIAGIFLADVLPALRAVMSRAQGRYR